MTTSSQLPVVQNLDLLLGSASTIPIALGMDLTQSSLQANAYRDDGGMVQDDDGSIDGTITFPLSITNAWTGNVVLSVSSRQAYLLSGGASWHLRAIGVSAEDPPELVRTLRWGRVSVTSPAGLPSSSPLYHAVEMVSGDEFTFQVNLGTSVGAPAATLMRADGGSEALPLSVVSPGIIKVTIDENLSDWIGRSQGFSWVLADSQSGAALRAGPVVAYTRRSIAGQSAAPIGETPSVPAAPTQIGSVFL